jgi:hypothetical protein
MMRRRRRPHPEEAMRRGEVVESNPTQGRHNEFGIEWTRAFFPRA